MSYQGRYQSGSTKPSGGTWKVVLIVILCVVLILGALFAAGYFFLESKLNKVTQAQFVEKDVSGQDLSHLIGNLDETDPTTIEPTTEATAEPTTEVTTEPTTEATTEATEPDYGETGKIVNILVIGQDSRGGEESKLADGIMLLTLNKETRTLSMTSFLRDSYVKLADYKTHTCGWNRINTSYALGYSWYGDAGAMEMLNLTLEYNYGLKVDGNVEFSFDTFVSLVDAIGGVEIDLQGDEYTVMREARDIYNASFAANGSDHCIAEVHEGVNLLEGIMALDYARQRHVNAADNDMNRVGRQQKVLAAVLDKVKSMSLTELNDLIDLVLSQIITNISTDDMKVYIKELTPYLVGLTLEKHQIPAEKTYWGDFVELPDGLSGVLKIDFEKNKKIVAAIQNGEEVPTFD